MRHLGFGDGEVIDQAAQDNYSKLFKPMVPESHIATMAVIFGWSVEEGEQVRSADVLAIL